MSVCPLGQASVCLSVSLRFKLLPAHQLVGMLAHPLIVSVDTFLSAQACMQRHD